MQNTAALNRDTEVAELLKGAVDLHCHSGPGAMPRILDHHEALMDADAAGFRALLYKDHFYLGVAQCAMLEKLVDTKVKLYSGLALNNTNGGINPHAVDHAVTIGAKIIWLPTLSAQNHIDQSETGAKNFPKTTKPMIPAEGLTAMDGNGKVSDKTKACLDLIAEGDIIVAGGHLPAHEIIKVFEEGKKRGVRKMLVNHPTYVVGCTDDDMRALVEIGAYLEHSILMFLEGKYFDGRDLAHFIELAGPERTVLSSDLGMSGWPRPLAGFQHIVRMLLDIEVPTSQIRMMIGDNAAGLLNLN